MQGTLYLALVKKEGDAISPGQDLEWLRMAQGS